MARRANGVQSARAPREWLRNRSAAPVVACAAVLFPALLAGCGSGTDGAGSGTGTETGLPSVVVSIFPVADLVERVGGDVVDVRVLLAPGASPSTFDATPATVQTLEGASLYVRVGGGLDGWTEEVVGARNRAPVVTLLEGVSLVDDGHGSDSAGRGGRATEEDTGNPHVWLDPIRTRDELLPRIVASLIQLRPDAAHTFEAGGRSLADSLTALDAEIRNRLSALENRAFVAGHPAWTYFAQRYDLLQLGVVHASPGREPSPRALAALVDEARAAEVPVVFTEPQLPDQGARAIASELGVPVLPLDPLGGRVVEGRDSYFSLMRYNTGQFVRGLGGP